MNQISQNVMIIEDDLLLLMVQERLVNNLGHKVVSKSSGGNTTFKLIKEAKPEVLIVDINLDGKLTGFEIVEKLKNDGSDIPVIFLTGLEEAEMIEKAEQLGAIDFLLKPITLEKLKLSLDKATIHNNKKIYIA